MLALISWLLALVSCRCCSALLFSALLCLLAWWGSCLGFLPWASCLGFFLFVSVVPSCFGFLLFVPGLASCLDFLRPCKRTQQFLTAPSWPTLHGAVFCKSLVQAHVRNRSRFCGDEICNSWTWRPILAESLLWLRLLSSPMAATYTAGVGLISWHLALWPKLRNLRTFENWVKYS